VLQIGILVMLVSLNLWAGLACRFGEIRATLADIGFTGRELVLSVVVVPLVALLFLKILALEHDFEAGIMLMAVSGGVPFLPLATSNAGGDIRASVSLVFILSAVSIITAPLTLKLLGRQVDITGLPIGEFIKKLALFQLLPLLLGSLVASTVKPEVTRVLSSVFRLITLVAIVAVGILLGAKVWQALTLVFATKTILAIVLIVATSMWIAWITGGRDRGKRVVLTDATGLRNPAIALLLANASFPGPLTESAIIAYLVVQILGSTVGGMLMKRARA